MRYLQGRNQFLNTKIQLKSSNFNQDFKNSKLIKEASAGMGGWENDITWGGSLIGRLLNSTIRRTAIYAKTTKIPFLLRQLENELLSLVAEVSLSEEDQKKLVVTQFKFLIMKVYNIVVSGDSVDKKLTQLIGDGTTDDQGTLNETIKLVEKIEDNLLEKKEELLTKLKGFRDALKEKDFEPEEFTDEDEEEEEEGGEGQGGKGEGQGKDSDSSKSGKAEFDFYTNTSNLFKALIELNTVIQNKRVGNEGDSDKTEYILGNHKLTPGQKYLWTNSKVNNAKPIEVILISTDFVIQPGKFKNYLGDVKKTEKLKPGVVFVKPHSEDQPMKVFYKDLKWIKPLNLEPETEYLYKDLDGKESVVKLVSLTHKKDKGADDKWFTDDDSELKEIRQGSAYVLRKDENGNFSKGSIVFSSLLSKTKVGSTGGSTGNVKPLDIIVGKEYLHTNKEGDAKIVKVISLDKSTGKQGGVLAKDSVFVAFKDEVSGKYTSRKGVFKAQLSELKSDSFKESYFYMNESLPIFENEAKLGGDEKNAKIAWSKVLNAVKNSKLSENSKLMKQVIEESKEGEKLNKKVIIALGKQIIKNEATEGKPISFEALIKEEMGTIPSKYSDITQTVSLMARILLAFKDDTGLLGQLGESGKPIKKFISAYDEMKKNLEKLPKDSTKSKKEEDKKEVQKVENIKDFYSFKMRLFEQADEEEEGEVEEDSGDMDFVEEAWYEFFEEGEEEAWIVSEEDGRKLQKSSEESTKNPFAIQDKDYDKVVRIVNIFAKAYKCYATDVIPSGRPGGKTSLKTYREYKYIGGGEGKTPQWSADGSAGPGPWAAKLPFGMWEDGVMKILEKPELRKVLANARFLPKDVEPLGSGTTEKSGGYNSDREDPAFVKKVRAGRSLFDFINDLLAGEGEFSKYRKRIMKEYFSGADKLNEKELKEIEGSSTQLTPKKEEISEPSEVGFFHLERFDQGTSIPVERFKKKEFFHRTFFRIKYKDGGNYYFLIGQFLYSTGDKVIVKFQKPENGAAQSIISRYISDDIRQKGWKLTDLTDKDLSLFVGVFEVSTRLGIRADYVLRSVELKRDGFYDAQNIISKKIEILQIEILGRNNDEKKLEVIQKIKKDRALPYDIDSENIKVDDFKEKKT